MQTQITAAPSTNSLRLSARTGVGSSTSKQASKRGRVGGQVLGAALPPPAPFHQFSPLPETKTLSLMRVPARSPY